MGHRLQAAANDFRGVGGAVQGEREDRAVERLAEEPPQADVLQREPELAEPVVDQEDLHQQRRTAEDEDVALGGPVQHRHAREPHRGEQQREDRARRERDAGELEQERHALDQKEERPPHEGEIHQLALRTPRMARSSAFWNNTVEMVVRTR